MARCEVCNRDRFGNILYLRKGSFKDYAVV